MMQNMMDQTASGCSATPGPGMPGMEAFPLFWVAMGVLLCLLVATCIWFFTRWLRQQRIPLLQDAWQPKDAYQDDQQGYHPQQPFPATYEEGGQTFASLQEKQPQVLHPEMMQVQR